MSDIPHGHARLRLKALHEEKTELWRRQEEAEAAPKAAYEAKNRGAGRNLCGKRGWQPASLSSRVSRSTMRSAPSARTSERHSTMTAKQLTIFARSQGCCCWTATT